MQLTENAKKVLQQRIYRPGENYHKLCQRVASAISPSTSDYQVNYQLMHEQVFLPNSPCLMGAGTDLQQLFACFVLPVEDSMESILDTFKDMCMIHKSGGGTGFNFSKLRPSNAKVRSTNGVASGPISFMKMYNAGAEQIKQGGRRRGANMGILNINHPDILRFITAKTCEGDLANFNLSVGVTNMLFNSAVTHLIDPSTGSPIDQLQSEELLDKIAHAAWANGEPGVLFLDTINRNSPHPDKRMDTTNPCGEYPALPYEPCVLGSINLNNVLHPNDDLSFQKLADVTRAAVKFLDSCIEASTYPLDIIEQMAKHRRKIGLGVMGLADVLIRYGLPYDSQEGRLFAKKIIHTIQTTAHHESAGRNTTCTAIAPTGTLSLIANCSSGIEPLFALQYERRVLNGYKLREYPPAIAESLQYFGAKAIVDLPKHAQEIFKTSGEIAPEDHVRMQAAIQQHVDNGVSKTVNLPNSATVADVKNVIKLAHALDCKGITVYRDGSRDEQVYCPICD